MFLEIPSTLGRRGITQIREAIKNQVNNFLHSAGEKVFVKRIDPLPLNFKLPYDPPLPTRTLDPSEVTGVMHTVSIWVCGPVVDGDKLPSPEGIRVEFGSIDRAKTYELKQPHKPDCLPAAYYPNREVIGQVVDDIQAWLFSAEVELGDTFSKEINQGERDCEVVKVGRTRVRVEYEMPKAGLMGGYIPIISLFGRKLYYGEY